MRISLANPLLYPPSSRERTQVFSLTSLLHKVRTTALSEENGTSEIPASFAGGARKIKPGKLDNANSSVNFSFSSSASCCSVSHSLFLSFSLFLCLRTREVLVCAELCEWKPRSDVQITPGRLLIELQGVTTVFSFFSFSHSVPRF